MRSNLKFIIASSPGHYAAAQRLLRAEGIEKQSIGFPTIMAWDGDELVGVCGTRIREGMILAGPLMVKTDRRRLFTIMRLAEAYEASMKQLGITTYLMNVDRDSILDKAIQRFFPHQHPYTEDETTKYIAWRVGNYHGRWSEGSGSLSGGTGLTEEPS